VISYLTSRLYTPQYLIRYGDKGANSLQFKNMLPNGIDYNELNKLEVSNRSNRIVEKIIDYYAEKRSRLPMKILSAIAILRVY
jgi:hypothetical protein